MKLKIAAMCLLMGAQPAQACHRFHTWHYKFPQNCRMFKATAYYTEHNRLPSPILAPPPPPRIVWPPFVFIRGAWEMNTYDWDVNRELSVEELKQRMK
jgi:hypothetical protein